MLKRISVLTSFFLMLTPLAQPQALDVGVYAKHEGAWLPLDPELMQFKQSSGLRLYTGRIDTNAVFPGTGSKMAVAAPLDILLVTPEGVSASEYQLVRLVVDDKHNARQVRLNRFGFTGNKTGIEQDRLIPFDVQHIASRQFVLHVTSAPLGEYALVPPAPSGMISAGKAFTFRIKDLP